MANISVRFLATGDCAVSVNFGNEISLEINGQVRSLHKVLAEHPIEGVIETVPTYCSLMVHYKPEIILYKDLIEKIKLRIGEAGTTEKTKEYIVEIPLLYGGEKGIDLKECAEFENMSVEEFIDIHSQSDYYVYMLGFAPGHAYTARFENPFHFMRRESPRVSIPGNVVVAAGNQTNLIPFAQPCGWNIIGEIPLKACDYNREDPFLLHAGDWVRYIPIKEREFQKIQKDALAGHYRCKRYERVGN